MDSWRLRARWKCGGRTRRWRLRRDRRLCCRTARRRTCGRMDSCNGILGSFHHFCRRCGVVAKAADFLRPHEHALKVVRCAHIPHPRSQERPKTIVKHGISLRQTRRREQPFDVVVHRCRRRSAGNVFQPLLMFAHFFLILRIQKVCSGRDWGRRRCRDLLLLRRRSWRPAGR